MFFDFIEITVLSRIPLTFCKMEGYGTKAGKICQKVRIQTCPDLSGGCPRNPRPGWLSRNPRPVLWLSMRPGPVLWVSKEPGSVQWLSKQINPFYKKQCFSILFMRNDFPFISEVSFLWYFRKIVLSCGGTIANLLTRFRNNLTSCCLENLNKHI